MKTLFQYFFISLITLTSFTPIFSKDKDKAIKSEVFAGLKFRALGPSFASGRIADFAVNPNDPTEFYVATASGGVWKTTNNGITFTPVFDNEGAYSIGVVEIDPNNPHVVWVGTGENNHQRALGYGDGVYKSLDGGKSWKNTGLKNSRQIGGIMIDPRNSNVVYVAAEGSVWGPGGDRGLYKTTDGGKTWKRILYVSDNTGINGIAYDFRNPDILYATAEQRRRHVFTKIGGGPESTVYKSEDAGKTWRKIMKGLPETDRGGMGLTVSPVNPDVLYLIVEAAYDKGGFYRSTDRGETWQKMSDYNSSGQYYAEIFCDPKNVDKVYSVDTYTQFTEDGGKTWKRFGLKDKHVDDHALWIDPNDTEHILIGGDGGVYVTYDGGANFEHITNLPVTQFYRVYVDDEYPFYNIYGGTQDNNSFGGPSQTLYRDGISNCDWTVTNGGDGFWGAIEPGNPDIVYSESQYGNMVRYDRKSGEAIDIRPEPGKDELSYKWNWNTPFIISPHSPTRLYTAANFVFRSDDRGNSWEKISGDITAQTDRNTWKVMGKYWSIDAVRKDVSTSLYGTAVALDESPVKENLLYVGTDDGVLSISEDAETWRQIREFPGVPEYTYISDIKADKFDENTVYVSFDNTKRDDFTPYLLKSTDKGESWVSIASDLPKNGAVHTIEQDFENPNLLFVGTEFGFFFSPDGGKNWIRLKSGLPTIPVRDIAIQKRENDLVLATFGRGFYVLDDYTPLREVSEEFFKKNDAYIFPVADALIYIQKGGRYGQGATFFRAPNPPFGAVFTYYLKKAPKTKFEMRKEREKKLFEKGEKIPQPSYDEIRKEKKEIPPHLIFTVLDEGNNPVRRITAAAKSGINRVNWDLRYPRLDEVPFKKDKFNPLAKVQSSTPVMPGKYKVYMSLYHDGKITPLADTVEFTVKKLNNVTLPAENYAAVVKFEKQVAELTRQIRGAEKFARELKRRTDEMMQAIYQTPRANMEMFTKAKSISEKLDDVIFKFEGQKPKASYEEIPPHKLPINARLNTLAWQHWRSTSEITQNEKKIYSVLMQEFPPVLKEIKAIYFDEIKPLEKEMEKIGAPWTSGRVPEFIKD